MKMISLHIAQWEGDNGLSYSTLSIDNQGKVWRYDPKCQGWVGYIMKPVAKDTCGGHRR